MGGNFSTALQIATGRLSQRLDGIDHDIVVLRDRAHLLQEEITMHIAEATNRNLHVLAIATLLFLPATVLTGVYGMNVKGIPFTEHESGFPWVFGLLVASTVLAYYVLKRLGLLNR
jgi:zinc transporter